MKKELNRWLWILVAVLTIGLMACSKDEPISPEEPEQPEQPENPGTAPEDPVEPVEDWGDERPHGFIFDIDSIDMPINEEGFLQFGDAYNGYTDYIVIEKEFANNKDRSKEMLISGPYSASYIQLRGKRATPWNNVNKYIELFRSINIRPDSKFSDFPELADLPLKNLSRFGMLTLETLVSVDVITHKYFSKEIPAGSSMRSTSGNKGYPVGISYVIADYDYVLSTIKGGGIFSHEPGKMYPLGDITNKLIMPGLDFFLLGYPDEPGDYPMTLRMEFANGTVLTKDFKVRYVNEE